MTIVRTTSWPCSVVEGLDPWRRFCWRFPLTSPGKKSVICSLFQVFTLTQVLCVYRLESRVRCCFRNTKCVCLFVCLFVCHRDVVRAAWFVCLFLKSPRGSFWQKVPSEQARTRVCFGWELRWSAYEETRGEEEKCQARGLRIWLSYVTWSSGKNNQKSRNRFCPLHNSNLRKSHKKYFYFIFLPPLDLLCSLRVPVEISGKLPTLGWSHVNRLLGERSRDANAA